MSGASINSEHAYILVIQVPNLPEGSPTKGLVVHKKTQSGLATPVVLHLQRLCSEEYRSHRIDDGPRTRTGPLCIARVAISGVSGCLALEFGDIRSLRVLLKARDVEFVRGGMQVIHLEHRELLLYLYSLLSTTRFATIEYK